MAERCQRILEAFYLGVMLMFVGNLIIFISLFFANANASTHVGGIAGPCCSHSEDVFDAGPAADKQESSGLGLASLYSNHQKKRKYSREKYRKMYIHTYVYVCGQILKIKTFSRCKCTFNSAHGATRTRLQDVFVFFIFFILIFVAAVVVDKQGAHK